MLSGQLSVGKAATSLKSGDLYQPMRMNPSLLFGGTAVQQGFERSRHIVYQLQERLRMTAAL